MSPYRYHVHGLAVASDIAFPELAAHVGAGGAPDIRIRQDVVPAWEDAEPTGAACASRRDGAVQLDLPGIGRVQVQNGCDVTVDPRPDVELPQLRAILLGSVMGMLCHQRGMMVLHASAVAFNGHAIAFAGEQGAGKSTLTAHCVAAGARLVADDVLVVSLVADKRAIAHPGVPGIKLWRHVLDGLGRSADGLTQAWADEEKYHVPFPAETVDAPVPLARICVLDDDDAASDGTAVRLRGAEAIASLITHTYRSEYLGVANARDRHFHDCARLAAAIDVMRFARRRDPQRLAATAALIVASDTPRDALP